jgi:hypothetical protein
LATIIVGTGAIVNGNNVDNLDLLKLCLAISNVFIPEEGKRENRREEWKISVNGKGGRKLGGAQTVPVL